MASAGPTPLGKPPFEKNGGNPNRRTIQPWMDPNNEYGQVEILQLSATNNGSLPNNPFIVGKTIEQAVGKVAGAYTEAKGSKYVIKVRNHKQFERLLTIKQLIDGTQVQIIPHASLNQVKCWAYCSDAKDMPEDQLLTELTPQGVIAVRRIMKYVNGVKTNTPNLILTFKGTVAPEHVLFGLLRVQTRTYYPLPLICYKCYSFGHAKTKCEEEELTCRICSQTHPQAGEGFQCQNSPFCKNCKQKHSPTSKKCPVYLKEDAIIRLKTDKGITYAEAKHEIQKQEGTDTFASKLKERLQNARQESEKDVEIKKLRSEMEQMKILMESFAKVKAENEKLRKALNTLYNQNMKPNPTGQPLQQVRTFVTETLKIDVLPEVVVTQDQSTTLNSVAQLTNEGSRKKRQLERTISNTSGLQQPPDKKLDVEEDCDPEDMDAQSGTETFYPNFNDQISDDDSPIAVEVIYEDSDV